MANDRFLTFTDTIVFDYRRGNEETLQTIKKNFNDAEGSTKPKALLLTIDGSHTGFVNGNGLFYTTEDSPVSVLSFTSPYEKPVLVNHDKEGSPLGRVKNAAHLDLDFKDANDLKEPKGVIQVSAKITDKDGIEKVLDGRYLTVSVSSKSKDVRCSIPSCKKNPLVDGICPHKRGKTYDGKLAYLVVGKREYTEISFVNVPADQEAAVKDIKELSDCIHIDADYDDDVPLVPLEGAVVGVEDASEEEEPEDKNMTTWLEELDAYEFTAEEAAEFVTVLDSLLDEHLGDAKLSTEERNKLSPSTFCGPDKKSFPVPDCAHVTAARRLIGRAKLSSDAKAKVLACVSRKAKSLGCDSSKNDETEEITIKDCFELWLTDLAFVAELQDQLVEARKNVEKLTADAQAAVEAEAAKTADSSSEDKLKELSDNVTALGDEKARLIEENANLRKQIQDDLAERVVDLKILLKKPGVESVLSETSADLRNEKRAEVVKEHALRDSNSLRDAIQDLTLEAKAVKPPKQGVESEGIVNERKVRKGTIADKRANVSRVYFGGPVR